MIFGKGVVGGGEVWLSVDEVMMNEKEFFLTVKKMREAQKAYFKSRLQGDLVNAKKLESEVDLALRDGLQDESKPKETQASFLEDGHEKDQ